MLQSKPLLSIIGSLRVDAVRRALNPSYRSPLPEELPAEICHFLRTDLPSWISDPARLDQLFEIFLGIPGPDPESEPPLPPDLGRRILQNQWEQITPRELRDLAVTPTWIAKAAHLVSGKKSLGPVVPSEKPDPRPSPPTPARPRVNRGILFGLVAFAACTLIVVSLAMFSGSASPPQYPTRERLSIGTLGPAPLVEAPRVVTWSLPREVGGYITVIEISEAGIVAVRPANNDACQEVTVPRSNPEVDLEMLFRPDPNGTKVVWLLLTDFPAAELLRTREAAMLRSITELLNSRFPSDLSSELRRNGIRTRALGEISFSPRQH